MENEQEKKVYTTTYEKFLEEESIHIEAIVLWMEQFEKSDKFSNRYNLFYMQQLWKKESGVKVEPETFKRAVVQAGFETNRGDSIKIDIKNIIQYIREQQ